MKIVKTEAKMKTVTIGEVCNAIETIVYASKVMGEMTLARIMTDEFYTLHDESFIKMLELAGDRAKSIQQDAYMKKFEDSIVSCGPALKLSFR